MTSTTNVRSQLCKREESPVEVNMDEWDRQLRAESTRLSRQGAGGTRVIPVMSHNQTTPPTPTPTGADPIDNLNQVLGSRMLLRNMKREIANLVMSRAGSHSGNGHALSDEMVDKVVLAIANELCQTPTPAGDATGRATIEHELLWSEVRDMPAGTETARPHAPVDEVPMVLERDRGLQVSKPVCPQPLKKVVVMPIKLRAGIPMRKTVTRSASSAFSECDSTASYQSLTQSNVSSKTNATHATNNNRK